MTIDYDDEEPLYSQLARILIGRIESGQIPPRRPIPSKRAIREEFGVSASTIERALDELRARGMIKTIQGRGLYVKAPSERKPEQLRPGPPGKRRRSR